MVGIRGIPQGNTDDVTLFISGEINDAVFAILQLNLESEQGTQQIIVLIRLGDHADKARILVECLDENLHDFCML